jgi:type IV secretion system protein VirB9
VRLCEALVWMLRSAVWLSLVLLALAVHAETLPMKGRIDPRIRTALYSADEVYLLYGYVGFHLDLEFEEDERFVSLSGGDLDALTYSARDNILTLKPKVASTEMNLAVTTTKRRYYFLYTAAEERPQGASDRVMYAVRFTYPKASGGPTLSWDQRVALDLAKTAQVRARNDDYWYCGDPHLRPIAASDDGVQTRLTFAAKRELPALFVRNDDDSESLLNFSIEGDDVVIHRVAARFVLRRGKLTGCIVNKGFVGSGERLKSGTISPTLHRDVREGAP